MTTRETPHTGESRRHKNRLFHRAGRIPVRAVTSELTSAIKDRSATGGEEELSPLKAGLESLRPNVVARFKAYAEQSEKTNENGVDVYTVLNFARTETLELHKALGNSVPVHRIGKTAIQKGVLLLRKAEENRASHTEPITIAKSMSEAYVEIGVVEILGQELAANVTSDPAAPEGSYISPAYNALAVYGMTIRQAIIETGQQKSTPQ